MTEPPRLSDASSALSLPGRPPRVLIFAPQTCQSTHRTGVQRVVVEAAVALSKLTRVDFVKWDPVDGQLRYFTREDLDLFFAGQDWPETLSIHPWAGRRRYRFGDSLQDEPTTPWLFMPEIAYHLPGGEQFYGCVLAQAQEYGLRTAAVFYDLIPINNPDYADSLKTAHQQYVQQLLRLDLILPISRHSGQEIEAYFRQQVGVDNAWRRAARQDIVPLLLATAKQTIDASGTIRPAVLDRLLPLAERDTILMLGTVEPRKRQVETLREILRQGCLDRHNLRVVVIGSLHPKVAEAFHALLAQSGRIHHLGYASEAQVADAFRRARFSIFASNDEGFGLPICESIAAGLPCLTANFGSMAEVAAGGGALTVDVNDMAAFGTAIAELARDDSLIERLQGEIRSRTFRSWADYGRDVLAAMMAWQRHEQPEPELAAAIEAVCRGGAGQARATVFDIPFEISRAAPGLAPAEGHRVLVFPEPLSPDAQAAYLADPAANDLHGAAVLGFARRETFNALLEALRGREMTSLLPTRCAFGDQDDVSAALAAEVVALARETSRRRVVALRERAYDTNSVAAVVREPDKPLLNIIISTYNRARFVAENVRWILERIRPFGSRVVLSVVDNASTDDTAERIRPYLDNPQLQFLRNNANVGMLGNLQVCSTLQRARHSWVIGDDDFMTPDTVGFVLDRLKESPNLPFIFLNFAVYYRAAFSDQDKADNIVHEQVRLAPNPGPTGIRPVRDMAVEHDNVFTAIYPIVFRSDILAACFNYPFTGKPFGSLVESIPTTKIILETYGETHCLWYDQVGIVGNAHNSWARYRVPWHGVLMPLVFELSRECGIDPVVLQRWSVIHRELYHEAKGLFPSESIDSMFPQRQLDASLRVFRGHPDLPLPSRPEA